MVFWRWSKDHSLTNELNLIKHRSDLMAKTIRSHPTYHILVLEPNLWTILIFSGFGPKMDLRFLHFPTSLRVKRLAPKGQKDAHGPSLHIRFLSKCHFWHGIYHIVSFVPEKTTFLNYCHILIILCISDSNMGTPILSLWFQNRTLISRLEAYPKGISQPFPEKRKT